MSRLVGGCLCGAIRFRVDAVFDVVYCHCSLCRRRSGAPVTLSLVVEKDAFHLTAGQPSRYRSSDIGESCFCSACGDQLFFLSPQSPYVSISHGALDDQESVLPQAHQWTGNRLAWFDIRDDLVRYDDGQLAHPAKRSTIGGRRE